jgi:lipopolysaccharide export system protein LptA
LLVDGTAEHSPKSGRQKMSSGKIAMIDPSRAASIIMAAILNCYASCAACLAQAPKGDFVRIAGISVEIKADSVERHERDNAAAFRGNASAIIGDVLLKAAEISVAYADIRDESAARDEGSTAPLSDAGREIVLIDLKGGVVATLPFNMQSNSDLAVLDMRTQQLTMRSNVVLSQGENSLRGAVLNINLATGIARFGTPSSKRNPPIYVPPEHQK